MPRPNINNLPPHHPFRRLQEQETQQKLERGIALVRQITDYVQARLDTAARARGYDNILSACSYFSSTVPKFADDAVEFIALRDAAWSTCYAILDAVETGKRPTPTMQEVILELPITLQ
jgi:hypothetical protein